MKIRQLAVLIVILGLGSISLFGQQFTGRVTDPSGAVVSKAAVTVHNEQTNVDTKTVTTGDGNYTVPYLKPGVYSVSAAAAGFKTAIRSSITLEVGQTSTVNLTLAVGSKQDSVTVVADAAQLDFAKADRGEVVENTRVTELPINGRDPNMLAQLNAGVEWRGNLQWQRPFDDTSNSISINGAQGAANELLLDGVTNESAANQWGNSRIAYIPPVDAVQEFKLVTNPYDAQYGHGAGGAIDMTLKSGSNRLHGDVYEYARRSWLDANSYQNDYLNAVNNTNKYTLGQHKLDQYGLELDGPVFIPKVYDGRNKSFFMTQYENWNEIVPNTIVTSVPDPAWLKGDFSNLTYWDATNKKYSPITIYDPLTLHQDVSGNWVRDPFPGNKIPLNRLDPVALKMLSYYPAPNLTPPPASNPFANNYGVPNPATNRYRNALGKWDQNISDKDRFSLRYGYWERDEVRITNGLSGAVAEGAAPHGERTHTFATDWVHTFSPNLLFDFRAMVNVRADYSADGPQGFDDTALGWSSAMVSQFGVGGSHFPKLQINEFAQPGNWGSLNMTSNTLGLLPSVTWIKGKHNVHAGMDLRLLQHAVTSQTMGPNFYVDRTWTQANYNGPFDPASGNSIASLLLGTASSGGLSISPLAYWSQHYYAPYVQDDWKVTPKLTLNLGFRWDLNGPNVERNNQATYAFNTTAINPVDALVADHSQFPGGGPLRGGITFLGVNGNPRSQYALTKTNFQPRVGFAYALNEKTVIRGGFGEMFMNPTSSGSQQGFDASTSYVSSFDGKTPLMNISNPFPLVAQPIASSKGLATALGQGTWGIDPNFKIPSFWSYSLGFQRQLTSHDTLEVSYVGSRTYNMENWQNINKVSTAYYKQCNVEMGGNHKICDDNGWVPTNPFYQVNGFQGSQYYSNQWIWTGNLTRPFPEYGDVTVDKNAGRSWYNSLQMTGIHKWSNSLTLHGTWTWSKTMNAGGYADQIYGIPYRALDGDDRTHRITISGVYMMPVGRGHKFLPNMPRVLDKMIGGWELGSLFIYETGKPWGVPGGFEYVGNAHVDRTILSNGFIRGVAPCVATTDANTGAVTLTSFAVAYGCKQPDFIQRPNYAATQNVVYTGIRLPSDFQFDSSMSKNFNITESVKLQLRLDAFNLLNHPLWQEGYSTGMDSNFGTIQKGSWGQSNLPRQAQLAIKILW